MFEYPIAISISPNTDKDDFCAAIRIFFQPWKWKKGPAVIKIEQWFNNYFKAQNAHSFNSGRSALFSILQAFGIGKDDEVLVQAFTCVAAIEPILWIGAKPVYVDIDGTLNIDPVSLEKQINKRTRAIIVQHTFGIPADIIKIKQIAQKYNLVLIEDCAHSLGATVNNTKVGMFGDAAYFSFGRDKVISSVFGGIAIINSKFPASPAGRKIQSSKLRSFQERLAYPDFFWIFQQLLHPIVFTILLPLYNIVIGKIIVVILQKLNLLSKPYYKGEYSGLKPYFFPRKFPNALAFILQVQLNKLDLLNMQRRKNANYYFENIQKRQGISLPVNHNGAIYLRFNLLARKAEQILKSAKHDGILLGNWYRNTIDPAGVDCQKIGYKIGSCPRAEEAAYESVNLPTYHRLTEEQLDRVIKIIEK